MRLVLIGDGDSPHLLKWSRALAQQRDLELWAVSTRGFAPDFDLLIPADRRLALHTDPAHAGGNIAVLRHLPALGAWLKKIDPDWLHAQYLTSHGTLAWVARRIWKLRARIAGSAWGSDILVTPDRNRAYRWLTTQVLKACAVTTSDSEHMSARMRQLGAADVMTFPLGLERLPERNFVQKEPWLFYANRGLEPIYRPQRVIDVFAAIAAKRPEARLIVANDGSLRRALEVQVDALGLADRVEFVGRVDANSQGRLYGPARWFLSLPESDSVSVSVLEAMAHECLPILSDLPANHEVLGTAGTKDERGHEVLRRRGLILADDEDLGTLADRLQLLASRADVTGHSLDADGVGAANRAWVAEHAMFGPAVTRFVARLRSA